MNMLFNRRSNQTPRTLTILALGLALTSSCEHFDRKELGVYRATQGMDCDRLAAAPTPELSERDDFNRRTPYMVIEPINVQCVVRTFGIVSVKHWASKGDPVAAYALAYVFYRDGDHPCAHTKAREDMLWLALSVESTRVFSATGVKRPIKRVPEAALALRDIAYYCRNEDTIPFDRMAWESGFDALAFVKE